MAGPGSYKYNFATNKGKGPKLLQSSFVESGQNVNDYYVSGNLLCRKSETSSPISMSGSLPKINQTFSGLDKFMKSRIFLKDTSSHNSSRLLNRSEISRIGGESQRQTRGGSPRFDDSTIGVREILGKETESDSIANVELSNLIKKVGRQIRRGHSETPNRHISPLPSDRKLHIPLKALPEIHLNNSFALTPMPMKNTLDWSPSEKGRRDSYLTGMAGQNRTLEMAKRRIRPRANISPKKKHNNSFSNGLYIRTPFDF